MCSFIPSPTLAYIDISMTIGLSPLHWFVLTCMVHLAWSLTSITTDYPLLKHLGLTSSSQTTFFFMGSPHCLYGWGPHTPTCEAVVHPYLVAKCSPPPWGEVGRGLRRSVLVGPHHRVPIENTNETNDSPPLNRERRSMRFNTQYPWHAPYGTIMAPYGQI